MKIAIACDSFKSSASSLEVAKYLAEGIHSVMPESEVLTFAIGDGGEGTLDALLHAGFTPFSYQVTGPTGKPVSARIAIKDDVALVEMAEASGLARLAHGEFAPLTATSFGTGELILKALDHDVNTIILAVGGSATTDAGAGALQALGAHLLGADGSEIERGGVALANLASIDLRNLDQRITQTQFILASDVTNPLLGQRGAAQVFAPQKGASLTDVALLEHSLARFAEVAGGAQINSPGAGAAGGMGFMAFTFLGAAQRSGIEIVIELSGLKQSLAHVDLVITGEGKFDSQSLGGKAPLGILTITSDKGIPVFLVCGQAELKGNHGFSKIYSLNSLEADIEKCISHPAPLLFQTGVLIASEL